MAVFGRSLVAEAEGNVVGLDLVETSKDTSTGDTTEDVGTSTLEEGGKALVLEDLDGAVNGALVVDATTRGHHHTTADSINRVGSETGKDSDTVAEGEGGHEVLLELLAEQRLERIVETKVEAAVHNDTNAGDDKTTVEAGNTVGGDGLLVDIDETVELAGTTLGGVLVVVGEAGTGVVERVDKEEGHGTSETTGDHVANKPHGVAVLVLLEVDEGLDLVLEGKVEGLCGEVPDDVGNVTTPEGTDTLSLHDALEAVADASVWAVEGAALEHLALVLQVELDALNGGGSRLGHGGSNTTNHKVLKEAELLLAGRGGGEALADVHLVVQHLHKLSVRSKIKRRWGEEKREAGARRKQVGFREGGGGVKSCCEFFVLREGKRKA